MMNAHRSQRLLLVRPRSLFLGMVLALLPALSFASPSAAPLRGDLGDAPDSTNHFGVGIEAYPGIKGFFPTVFDPALGLPQGPLHWYPKQDSWLGKDVSAEYEADQLPDNDGVTNLDPPANTANRDALDDGVFTLSPTISLPQCQMTQFRYIVTGAPTISSHPAYVNVWFDFNRDGDWQDVLKCSTSTGSVVPVYEWAVQNQVVTVNPGSAIWSTPLFRSAHPSTIPYSWMRITLAETQAPVAPSGLADGRGPGNGYHIGETEDYFLKLCTSCPAGTYYGY